MAESLQASAQMMGADARLHTDETGRKIGKAHRNLAARQLLAQNDSAALVKADHMETVFADADG